MKPKALDVVLLKDGREVTVLEVLGEGACFHVEYDLGNDCEWFDVTPEQIEKIIWEFP